MATRRNVGAGLSSVGQMLQALLKQRTDEKGDYRRAALNLLTQSEMEEQRSANDTRQTSLTALLSDRGSDIADRLAASGQDNLNGVKLRAFAKTDAQRQQPLLEDIESADSLEKLGTPTTTVSRASAAGMTEDPYYSNPNFPKFNIGGTQREVVAHPMRDEQTPIEELLKAQESKRATLEGERRNNQASEEVFNPTAGTKGFTNRLGDFVPTEATGQQAGQQEADRLLNGELSNPVVAAAAQKAGSISGAQSDATIASRFQHKDQIAAVEEAIAKARAVPTATNATAQKAAVVALSTRMIELANMFNKDSRFGMAKAKGWGQQLAGSTGIDFGLFSDEEKADIGEFQRLRNGTASMFARLLGHSGVLTEQDVERTMQILPDFGMTPDQNTQHIAMFLKATGMAEQLGNQLGQIDPSLPESVQQLEASRRLNLLFDQLEPTLPNGTRVGDDDENANLPAIEDAESFR